VPGQRTSKRKGPDAHAELFGESRLRSTRRSKNFRGRPRPPTRFPIRDRDRPPGARGTDSPRTKKWNGRTNRAAQKVARRISATLPIGDAPLQSRVDGKNLAIPLEERFGGDHRTRGGPLRDEGRNSDPDTRQPTDRLSKKSSGEGAGVRPGPRPSGEWSGRTCRPSGERARRHRGRHG